MKGAGPGAERVTTPEARPLSGHRGSTSVLAPTLAFNQCFPNVCYVGPVIDEPSPNT